MPLYEKLNPLHFFSLEFSYIFGGISSGTPSDSFFLGLVGKVTSETYSEPWQTSMMVLLEKIVKG